MESKLHITLSAPKQMNLSPLPQKVLCGKPSLEDRRVVEGKKIHA